MENNITLNNRRIRDIQHVCFIQRSLASVLIGFYATSAAGAAVGDNKAIVLVRDNRAKSVLVLPDSANEELKRSAESFVNIVEKSTGARLPTIPRAELSARNEHDAKIFIQPLKDDFPDQSALPEETYRIVTKGSNIYILASPSKISTVGAPRGSEPVRWALNRLLKENLKASFLWPGELGTYVPRQDGFRVTPMDVTHQPKLLIRNLRVPFSVYKGNKSALFKKLEIEMSDWLANHEFGRRGTIRFGHAFVTWWDKYGKEHPDYFATPLPGMASPIQDPKFPARAAKLRLSNPAVIEQIASEYLKAGAPKYYNVCPNDGAGYDLTPATLAWDIPQNQSPDAIWAGSNEVQLTARYVEFWNRLYHRLKEINPDVVLLSYAYSSYKAPPPVARPLSAKMMIGIVDSWDAFDSWKGWSEAGATLLLRPNWGFVAAGAPLLPLQEIHHYLQFASAHGMIGFDLDTMMGYWGTEGPLYYLFARILAESDLSIEQILEEYTAAFGVADPSIREYFDYWQKIATEIGSPSTAGGSTGKSKGKFRALQESKTISGNYLHGPYEALAYLYPDKVLEPAYQILSKAEKRVIGTDQEACQRVEFLRQGLDQLRLTRDAAEIGNRILKGERDSSEIRAFEEKAKAVTLFRATLTASHVMWADTITYYENRYKVAVRPRNINLPTYKAPK